MSDNKLQDCKLVKETNNTTIHECNSWDLNVTIISWKLKRWLTDDELNKIKENAAELWITIFEGTSQPNELKE